MCANSINHSQANAPLKFQEEGDKKCLGHIYGVPISSNELGQYDVKVAMGIHPEFCHESVLYIGRQAVLVQFHFDNDPSCGHYIHKIDPEVQKAALKRFYEQSSS